MPTVGGEKFPGYVTLINKNTIVVSDNEYLLDGTFQHNRHNWFMSSDGRECYSDYTESYTHTWAGKNAVVCRNKCYMLSDGNTHQSPFEEEVLASSLLVFNPMGNLLKTLPLTYGGIDWDSDGKNIWVYEHDHYNIYLEQISCRDDSIKNTIRLGNYKISATSSLINGLSYGYYYGKLFSFANNHQESLVVINNALLDIEDGNGDTLVCFENGNFKSKLNLLKNNYGGWSGAIEYCPLTDTLFIGTFDSSHRPIIIECDVFFKVIYTYELPPELENVTAIDQIKYNKFNETLVIYNYWSSPIPGQIFRVNPKSRSIIGQYLPILDVPSGYSVGYSVAINQKNGNMYFPQRYDSFSSGTGSIKMYAV